MGKRPKGGHFVYTCYYCGREGEKPWMLLHVRQAHQAELKRDHLTPLAAVNMMDKRIEYVYIRDLTGIIPTPTW